MIYLALTWLLAPFALLRLALTPRTSPPRTLLVIQTAKIGDYICTTPVLVALRLAYPAARLCLLVHPTNAALARCQPGVDRVLTLPAARRGLAGRWALYRLLRCERFDLSVCLSPNQSFLLLPFLAGIPRRASVLPNHDRRSYRLAAPFQTDGEAHRQGRMLVETAMALLKRLGLDEALPEKVVGAAAGAAERTAALWPAPSPRIWIGLGVSSGNKLKELGQEKLIRLAAQLLDLDGEPGLVLIGSTADRDLAAEVATAVAGNDPARTQRLIDSTGKVALEDLAALLDRLSLYIGVDSGITYMADSRRVPVIDLMGPADAEDQRPTGPRAVVLRPALPCAPCSHAFSAPYACRIGTRACIAEVDIDKISGLAGQIIDPLPMVEKE